MKTGKKTKKHGSPSIERTRPSFGSNEHEVPPSPGKPPSRPGFLSRLLSNKSINQETPAIVSPTGNGRVTPEQIESRESSERQKSRDGSPKSMTTGIASSTYRSVSQSFTDLAGITSRSKPSSPDIDSVLPSQPLSPRTPQTESTPPEKPILLPFKPESIQRQGWLNKRPESDFKRSKSGVAAIWKLQRAIVHDSRLYLYNPPSSLGIRAFKPSESSQILEPIVSPVISSHAKHAHSPSEGVAVRSTTGQVNFEELARRPSTAPHATVTEKQDTNIRKAKNDEISAETVRLNNEKQLVGGSVAAICSYILTHSKSSDFDNDTRIFCMTTGFWAPVEVILLDMTRIASKQDVHIRLQAIIKFWCDETPRILWEEGSKEAMHTLVDEGIARIDQSRGRALNLYIIQAHKKFKALLQPFAEMNLDAPQRVSYLWRLLRIDDIEAAALAEQGLTGSVLLRIPAEIFAEQLFIFHLKYLGAVDPANDMSLLLDRSASHRCRSPLVFSQSSPHFLTRLVYTHILGLDSSDSTIDVSLRAKYLTRWIEIGQCLKTRGDLAGFLAIATALLSMPILRLKETWTDIQSELRTMVIRDWSPMMKELHRRELGQESGVMTAHVLTPDLTQQDLDSHFVIPYYGDICAALESFDIWASTPETDVNFSQIKEAFASVRHAISRWISFKEASARESGSLNDYFVKRSRSLQAAFEDLHTSFADGFPYSVEQLFEASIQAESPPQGAYIEHHYAKRLSVTSGSYVPLMLTDVLPSYKLFDQTDLLEALATVDKRAMYGGPQTSRSHRERPTSPSSSNWAAAARGGNKPSPLRRTNSYPPSKVSLATTGNANLDYSTHNRIAGLTSRHFPMLKALRDIAGVEQSLLHVQDGELVLKVVTDANRLSRPGSAIIETSSKRASLASKRSSAQVLGPPTISTPPPGKLVSSARNSFHPEIPSAPAVDVVTKAGSLDRLVDVLVLGIEDFGSYLMEDNVETTGKKTSRLQMNIDEFRTTFLATFRSFCSPTVLLDYLRKRFVGAVYVAAHINEDEDSEDFSESFPDWTPIDPLSHNKVDWQLVGKIQCGVLDTISLWVAQYFSDFLNTPNLGMDLIRFLAVVHQELLTWDEIFKTKPYVAYFSHQIASMAKGIRKAFATTFYRPSYYSSSFRTPANFIFMPSIPVNISVRKTDQFMMLFNDLDDSLLQLYQQVTTEDWMSAFEVLEIQSTDICGFYSPNGNPPIRDEDLRLRSIFTIISQLQRPRGRGPLLDALPKSIRQLHRLHENLTCWTIAQISDTTINVNERASRIQSLIAFLRSSRQRMSYLDFYSNSEQSAILSEERSEQRLSVPSFIASAVASALVSPESRAFGGAWARVLEAEDEIGKTGCDTLAEFVYRKSAAPEPGVARTLTPCLGWIIERMLEIACYVPNMSLESTRLINFDKRRYIFNLISNIVPSSDDFDLLDNLIDSPLSQKSFADQLICSDLLNSKMDLKAIRDVALSEWIQSEHKYPKLFRTLIADEQRKNRRDQRRRMEIEKQLRDNQKSRPLGIREAPSQPDLREAARSGRDTRSKGAKGMFLRTIRPLSIAISSNPFGEKAEARVVKAEELPKTMSIPPGTRASQKLSLGGALVVNRVAYEKEHVFSIRTEEGQECWLQSVDAQDMSGWVSLLTSVATTAKSRGNKQNDKSKEAESSKVVKPPEPVFGVKLEVLCEREGRDVPWVIEKLIDDVERRGLDEVGLYRVPGSMMSVKALAAALNAGEDVDMDDPRWLDINVVAGTLKTWLRELPESILTPALFDKFTQSVAIQDYEEKYYAIKELVHQLPRPNFNLLKRLIYHLKRVADNEPVNHMNAPNLAICLAPVIVASSSVGSFAGTMESMGRAQSLLRDLIIQCEWIFDETVVDEDQVEDQPTQEEDPSGAGYPGGNTEPEVPQVMSV